MGAELIAFLGIAALVIVTPGQDTALTIRNTLLGGRRVGRATALGVASGQAVWTVAASAGGGGADRASGRPSWRSSSRARATSCCSGCGTLWAAVREGPGSARTEAMPSRGGSHAAPGERAGGGERRAGFGPRKALRQGLVSNLANPKMVFFTSLLPQFAPAGGTGVPGHARPGPALADQYARLGGGQGAGGPWAPRPLVTPPSVGLSLGALRGRAAAPGLRLAAEER